MNSIVLLTLSVLAIVVPTYAQFGLFDTGDCNAGRLVDPFLVQALKSKYPKKFSGKLDYAKDLALDTKCKLQTAKLLARHMKNLNSANYDLQSLLYQSQQPGFAQPMMIPDQSAFMAQQQQQQQQQQLTNIQIPIDTRALTLTPQADSQTTCYSQYTDPRYQQAVLQLGAQRYENSDPLDEPTPCTKPDCPCNCEACEESARRSVGNPFSSIVSTFCGVLRKFLK